MKSLSRSLVVVARALGDALDVKVSIGGETAFAIPGHINIPSIPETDEAAALAFGYEIHECGHIRFTDFNAADSLHGLPHKIWNIIEDGRIETEMMKLYPGAKTRLDGLSQHLDVPYHFASDIPPVIVVHDFILYAMHFLCMERSWTEEAFTFLQAEFTKHFGATLCSEVTELVKDSHKLESTTATVIRAQEVVALLNAATQSDPEPDQSSADKDQRGDQDQTGDSQHGDDGQQDGQNQSGDSQHGNDSQQDGQNQAGDNQHGDDGQQDGQNQSGDSQHGDDGQQDGQNQAGDSQHGNDGQQDGQNQSGDSQHGNDGQQDGQNQSGDSQHGDDGQQDGQNQAGDSQHGDDGQQDGQNQAGDSQHGNDGQQDGQNQSGDSQHGDDGQLSALESLKNALKGDVAQLRGRDDQLKQKLEGIAQLAQEEGLPRVFMLPIEKVGRPQSGASFKIDASARALARQLGNLLEAKSKSRLAISEVGTRISSSRLARTRVGRTDIYLQKKDQVAEDTAIFLLTDQSLSMSQVTETPDLHRYEVARDSSYLVGESIEGFPSVELAIGVFPKRNGVGMIKEFGESMRVAAPKLLAIEPEGTTPIGSAIITAAVELLRNKSRRKILVVSTDGEPDNDDELFAAIKFAESNDIEVVGIGICSDAGAKFFKSWSSITRVCDLPSALINQLKRLLA